MCFSFGYLLQVRPKTNASIQQAASHMERVHLFQQACLFKGANCSDHWSQNEIGTVETLLCLCSSMCLDFPVFNDILKKWSSPQRWKSAVPIITWWAEWQKTSSYGLTTVIWTPYPMWVKHLQALVACSQGNSELGFLKMSQCWPHHGSRNKPSKHQKRQSTRKCVRSPLLAAVINQPYKMFLWR